MSVPSEIRSPLLLLPNLQRPLPHHHLVPHRNQFVARQRHQVRHHVRSGQYWQRVS